MTAASQPTDQAGRQRALFDATDTDHDGVVTRAELKAYQERFHKNDTFMGIVHRRHA
ncbi:hypothetical protein ACIO1C_05770 [Streptomyces sp. NPDC087420]|uniref:hypothetical protein n=1 Tax=Streptomyces sp. NPDC087420 TaxID=3365785 RepID=UPI0038348CF4